MFLRNVSETHYSWWKTQVAFVSLVLHPTFPSDNFQIQKSLDMHHINLIQFISNFFITISDLQEFRKKLLCSRDNLDSLLHLSLSKNLNKLWQVFLWYSKSCAKSVTHSKDAVFLLLHSFMFRSMPKRYYPRECSTARCSTSFWRLTSLQWR